MVEQGTSRLEKTHLSEVNCEQKPKGACSVMSCLGRGKQRWIGSEVGVHLACWRNCKISLGGWQGQRLRYTHSPHWQYVMIFLFTAVEIRGQDVVVFGG